jgi:hypothetical protein
MLLYSIALPLLFIWLRYTFFGETSGIGTWDPKCTIPDPFAGERHHNTDIAYLYKGQLWPAHLWARKIYHEMGGTLHEGMEQNLHDGLGTLVVNPKADTIVFARATRQDIH